MPILYILTIVYITDLLSVPLRIDSKSQENKQ